jgi:class 3 adenylate cyclase/transposase-like protein
LIRTTISCTEKQSASIHEKAVAAGYASASRWLVEQALTGAPDSADDHDPWESEYDDSGDPDIPRGRLTPEEKQELLEAIKSIDNKLSKLANDEDVVADTGHSMSYWIKNTYEMLQRMDIETALSEKDVLEELVKHEYLDDPDDLTEYVRDTFNTPWNIREKNYVPKDKNVELDREGVFVEAACLCATTAEIQGLSSDSSFGAVAKLHKCYFKCVTKIIRQHNGSIIEFDGHRIIGVFVGDRKNTNAAISALKINHAAQNIIYPVFAEKFNNPPSRLNHAVGIDTGLILFGRAGIRGERDLIWSTTNHATRLSRFRKEGYNIWITKVVYDDLSRTAKSGKEGRNMWEEVKSGKDDEAIFGSNWTWPFEWNY